MLSESLMSPLSRPLLAALLALMLPAACSMNAEANPADEPPAARWDHRPDGEDWTRATLAAISSKGQALTQTPLSDVTAWCPGYPSASEAERQAFWVGIFSALAKHESTWNPAAAGAGGKYRGLLQISPTTARAYGCDAGALYEAEANLSCAVKIASRQVARTGKVVGEPGAWGGLAMDWGPMRNASKRQEMASWTRAQDYCKA